MIFFSLFTGASYAYEDETSSDSDDEVLKRFKSSMETTAAIKRSNSRYSQKGDNSVSKSASRHSMGRQSRGSIGSTSALGKYSKTCFSGYLY